MTDPVIHIVDDDKSLRLSIRQFLECCGHRVTDWDSAEGVLQGMDASFNGIILSDVRMPGMDGLGLLSRIMEVDSDIPVILITAHADVPMAVDALRRGAYDFIEKPFNETTLDDILHRALEKRRLVLALKEAKAHLAAEQGLDARLVGSHPRMRELKRRILDVAPTNASVLLTGETGTGKEAAARCLHDASPRAARPLVVVDCASIPLSLAESELFGYVRGAFTGADRNHMGKLEAAAGGTLFLDEINSLPMEVQGKLLRALQEKSVTPLGSHSPRPVNFRLISSTNEELKAKIAQGRFREDLYYRIATLEISLPPLREHKDDIPLLFNLFAEQAATAYGKGTQRPDHAALSMLMARDWPGNVRELKNMAERYVLSGSLGLEQGEKDGRQNFFDHVCSFERQLITEAIKRHQGDMRAVMEELGLPRRTLNEKMSRLGISRAHCRGGE